MIKNYDIVTDIGLDIEMKDVLESMDIIEKFDIEHNEKNQYLISVETKEFDKNKIDEIFMIFFNFIRYRDINIYERSISEDGISYHFFSAKSNKNGFYCFITFK